MKIHRLFIGLALFFASFCAYAGWQVVNPSGHAPREPFFQAKTPHAKQGVPVRLTPKCNAPLPRRNINLSTRPRAVALPRQYANAGHISAGRPVAIYAVSISGSLKENIERIMGRYHWKVVWKAPYDYNFDGRVTGTSLPNVVDKLFQPFPLQAIMYMSNRTLAIVPRYKT